MLFKNEQDLKDFINNRVIEKKDLEYKLTLPNFDNDTEKVEILADISSFANTNGGVLIYGIREEAGEPKEIVGMEIEDIDKTVSRIENILRDGIKPRIPGIETHPIKLSTGKIVLIISIPKSFISPHRVIFRGHDKFYARNTNGKYQMDVDELRIAFNLSQTITEKIRDFRKERIAEIMNDETPVPMPKGAKICLHLIPFISLKPGQIYELKENVLRTLPPIYSEGWNYRYNFDGFVTFNFINKGEYSGKSWSYVQFFRNGILESVDGQILKARSNKEKRLYFIPGFSLEKELIKAFKNYLTIFKTLNIELPIFVFLSLTEVKGYSMFTRGTSKIRDDENNNIPKIDRNVLLLPEVLIETYDCSPEKVLKPCFDSIWNACGYPYSHYYNEKGEWIGEKKNL